MPAKGSKKRDHGTGSIFEHNGSVTFRFRPVRGKPQVQRKVCRIGELGKTAIEAKCRQIEAEYKPPSDAKVPTVSEAGIMHIKQLELDGKAKSYTRNRRRTLRIHIEPELGECRIDSVKPKDINRWKTTMQQAGKGQATIHTAYWLLSGIFKFAKEEEWRTDNPVTATKTPEYEHNHPIVYMSPAEVNRVIAAIPDDEWGKAERVLYRCGQKSAQRRCELVALRWEDCEFELDGFRVERGYVEGEFTKTTKGKKARFVPMVADLKEELLNWRKITRYPADSDLVFADPITGGPLNPGKITKRFNKALLKAKVGPTEMREYERAGKVCERPHPLWEFRDLRDTAAVTFMSNPNVAPRETQEILGHRNLATTSARYGGFLPTADLAERMAASFDSRSSTGAQSPQGEAGHDGVQQGSASTREDEGALPR